MKPTQTIRKHNDRYEDLEERLLSWESDSEKLISEMQDCMEAIIDASEDEYERIVLHNNNKPTWK